MDEHKSIPEISAETKLIYARLSKCAVGDMVPYSELSTLSGRDVTREGRGNLNTARRMAQRLDSAVFEAVRGEGVKRLDDVGIVTTAHVALNHIRRTARRAAIRQTCVQNFDALPAELKTRHNGAISICGVLALFTSTKRIARIEEAVSAKHAKLPAKEMLKLFNGSE